MLLMLRKCWHHHPKSGHYPLPNAHRPLPTSIVPTVRPRPTALVAGEAGNWKWKSGKTSQRAIAQNLIDMCPENSCLLVLCPPLCTHRHRKKTICLCPWLNYLSHFEEIKLDLGNCKKMYAKLSKEFKWGLMFGISHWSYHHIIIIVIYILVHLMFKYLRFDSKLSIMIINIPLCLQLIQILITSKDYLEYS